MSQEDVVGDDLSLDSDALGPSVPQVAEPVDSALYFKVERMLNDEAVDEVLEKKGIRLNWPDRKRTRSGTVVCNSLENVVFFLQRFGIAVHYDEFALEYVLSGVPNRFRLDDGALNDIWAAMHFCGLDIAKDRLLGFLKNVGDLMAVHPARELFDRLECEWDGVERLDGWLPKYCYAEGPTEYLNFVSAAPLIAIVRRVRLGSNCNGGYPFKYMPVLEGPQDIRKSGILRTLSLGWFNDNLQIGASSKEVMELSGNVLIQEFAELENMNKKEVGAVKAFLSRSEDRARLSYDRFASRHPRQFGCFATTNDQEYLRDPTGNDRFWPVRCGGSLSKPLDTAGLKEVVHQLWGEAAVRERRHESVYPTASFSKLAHAEQARRRVKNDYMEELAAALKDATLKDASTKKDVPLTGFIPNHVVFTMCGIPDDPAWRRNPRITKPIKDAMTELGWVSTNTKVGTEKKQMRGYIKGVDAEAVTSYLHYSDELGWAPCLDQ